MDQLNKQIIKNQAWPEKVIQFGTGVLLRGLPDYFIDKANKQGLFNGSILVVKSTGNGGTDVFREQDNLYTLVVKGIENGQPVDEKQVNGAISRVLAAADHWGDILEAATRPETHILISNTTEVGITLQEDDELSGDPPVSFPGKLLALLLHRYQRLGAGPGTGLVVLPTELISENGHELKKVVLQLAGIHGLDAGFMHWLETDNYFCNTLVDRIVPGALSAEEKAEVEKEQGYRDDLMIMAEPFRLWAIEAADPEIARRLTFAAADKGVVIVPDINKFKELKLRLLNGTHTVSCALAILSGFSNVRSAMQHEVFRRFIRRVMHEEIIPSLQDTSITAEEAREFADSVTDRFSNPHLDHKWNSISMNYTAKMNMRNVPVIAAYARQRGEVPALHALGFAAYLLLMQRQEPIQDTAAPRLKSLWDTGTPEEVVDEVLNDGSLWSENLDDIVGWADAVKKSLVALMEQDTLQVMANTGKKEQV